MEMDDDVALALMRIAEGLDAIERAEHTAANDGDRATLERALTALRSAQRELVGLIALGDAEA
jgi:hypothetical protein